MSAIFVRTRNRGRSLLRTTERRDQASTPNIVVVGVGTAGGRRALLFLQRMAELSAVNRIQSAVFYDCNETTISHIGKYLGKFLGRSRTNSGIRIIFPSYVPLPNGFMRDPQQYLEYSGPFERDMDNVVAQIMVQSDGAGRAPSIIIEFMGFAGHSVLGAQLHRKLQEAFPSSVLLPVLMLPTDHVCEEWTRRYIWEQYEGLLAGSNCLVTTQSASNAGEDDIRLATGLAGIEVAEFDDEETADSPLAASCRRIIPSSSGWLGMAVVRRRMPIIRKFKWSRVPPWWNDYAALGPQEELSTSLGHAIWATLDPASQMAVGVNHSINAPQEVVVSLPVHPEALEPLASEAAEVLERSTLFSRYPNMDVAFNTARFAEGLKKEPYVHVTRLYPIQGELGPVMNILHPDRLPGDRRQATSFETGFGSYYHVSGGEKAPPLVAVGPAASPSAPSADSDDDPPPTILYI